MKVEVAGRVFWLEDAGSGSPTVVCEAGWGDTSAAFETVFAAVAGVTRVVRYDRAGMGRSDRREGPSSTGRAAEDLHALLGAAGIAPPYVLVGHSWGGLIARVFAGRWPGEVAGLVLVDASHEEQEARFREILGPAQLTWLEGVRRRAGRREPLDLAAGAAEVAAHAGDLGDRPLVVVAQGRFDDEPPPEIVDLGIPVTHVAKVSWIERAVLIERTIAPLWRTLQERLARLSTRGELVVARGIGHDIPRDAPGVVVAAIRRVLERLRG